MTRSYLICNFSIKPLAFVVFNPDCLKRSYIVYQIDNETADNLAKGKVVSKRAKLLPQRPEISLADG